MEIVANGHDLAIYQNNPRNLNINNNRELNGHENGHMQVHGNQAVRHEKIDLSLNSWQKVLFPWILLIVHTIVRYIVAIGILWSRLRRKITTGWSWRKLCTARTSMFSILWPGWCSIKDEVQNSSIEIYTKEGFGRLRYLADTTLKKKPSHVAFAILEGNKFSYGDLANMVTWCIAIGIHNITLYDLDGKLKSQKTRLSCEIYKNVPLEVKTASSFLWTNHIGSSTDSHNRDFPINDTDFEENTIFKVIIQIKFVEIFLENYEIPTNTFP